MTPLRYVFAALGITALLPAAPQGPVTASPAGMLYVEGGGDSRDVLGTLAKTRYQQIDSTLVWPLTGIRSLSLRRDGRLGADPAYGARTVDLELILAEGDINNFSRTFANNHVANAVTVLPRKQVQFPDWSAAPGQVPSSALLTLPFAQPFHYSGASVSGRDLVWDVKIYSNSAAGSDYPFDLEQVVPNAIFGQLVPTRSGHVDLGFGCQVATGESHMDIDIWNFGSKFTLDAHLHTAANAPVILNLGFFNAGLKPPGFCATIFALPGIALPVGMSNGIGDMDIDIDPIPYNPAIIGMDVYAQCVAPDASQPGVPLALSSGAKMTIPTDPRGPAMGRLWSTDPAATRGANGPFAGGIVAQLGQ